MNKAKKMLFFLLLIFVTILFLFEETLKDEALLGGDGGDPLCIYVFWWRVRKQNM